MMDERSLLPCPFCGGEAKAYQDFAGGIIMYSQCGAMMRNKTGFKVDDIIPAWNRRIGPIKIVNNGTLELTRGRII